MDLDGLIRTNENDSGQNGSKRISLAVQMTIWPSGQWPSENSNPFILPNPLPLEILMFLRKLRYLYSLRLKISSFPRATGNGDSLREFWDSVIIAFKISCTVAFQLKSFLILWIFNTSEHDFVESSKNSSKLQLLKQMG